MENKEELRFPDFRVDGKVALVTGAARGIGRICALALANSGANVVVVDIAKLDHVARELEKLGSQALAVQTDITEPTQIDCMVNDVMDKMGRVDILVNNAGVCFRESALEVSEKTWGTTFDVNVKGLFFCSQRIAPNMISRKKGKIINIASMLGVTALPEHASYCASKAGVCLLTKVLAMEWGKHNINVNAIGPTFIKTEMASHVFEDPQKYQSIVSKIPLGRIGDPMDVAAAVIYLASPASDLITGEVLLVDGGWTTGKEGVL